MARCTVDAGIRQIRGAWWVAAALVVAVLAPGARAATADAAYVGTWSGESLSDEHGVQRWTVERRADGHYSAQHSVYRREGPDEHSEEGRWSVRDGVLSHEPTGGDAARQAWLTQALAGDCLQLQALDGASGRPMSPVWRASECRVPGPRPLPERIHHGCVMDAPGMEGGTMDLQIVREADGQYHAIGDGERDAQAVEVRDYPVLREFRPRESETLTNAGEGLLTLVQMNLDRSDTLRRSLGFDPAQARSVRVWVISPPRPQRPMEYYEAGRFVLMQAFDADDRLLGGAAYTPFIVACPPQP